MRLRKIHPKTIPLQELEEQGPWSSFLTLTFFAITHGFVHPRVATNEPFREESLQKETETEEFKKRLRILFVIWQVRLMLDKIWTFRDKLEKLEKAAAKSGQEKLLTKIATNFDTGPFTPRAWLKMLQGGL